MTRGRTVHTWRDDACAPPAQGYAIRLARGKVRSVSGFAFEEIIINYFTSFAHCSGRARPTLNVHPSLRVLLAAAADAVSRCAGGTYGGGGGGCQVSRMAAPTCLYEYHPNVWQSSGQRAR